MKQDKDFIKSDYDKLYKIDDSLAIAHVDLGVLRRKDISPNYIPFVNEYKVTPLLSLF